MIRVNVRGNGVVSGVTARQYAFALVAVRYARYVRFAQNITRTHQHTHIQSTISIVHPKFTSLTTTTHESIVLDDPTSSCSVLLERKLLQIYES